MPEFETIGKYEILDVIGEGGFGIVYKARDPHMERLVAIKVCSTEDEQIRKRFLREAKIAGGLDHPNIVTAFDFGRESDLPYLVQELLTGEDLRIRIDRKDAIQPTTKLDYLAQIAKGLQYAHEHSVLHRDIKPANVRILDDDRVKLMDFGMAKITKESGTRLTEDGSVMGTAGYFAPEQLKALDLDQRVDIFSYGVLAYELLTYRKAFPGETFMVVFRQVLQDEPEPIREVWPECPEALAEMVEKCLQKEPDERFASFDEILPILYSVLSSKAFDRRALSREAELPPQVDATVMKPLHDVRPPRTEPPATATPAQTDSGQQATLSASPSTDQPALSERPPPPEPGKPSARIFANKGLWGIVAVGALLVASLAIWLLGGPDDETERGLERQPAAMTEAQSRGEKTEPTAPAFLVFVDALPWGEIVRVTSAAGEDLELERPIFTPVNLALSKGIYEISVADPRSGVIESCQLEASTSSNQSCRVEFESIEAVVYFKEAGWWE